MMAKKKQGKCSWKLEERRDFVGCSRNFNKTENVPELMLLDKEVSIQIIEDINWFLLVVYHTV